MQAHARVCACIHIGVENEHIRQVRLASTGGGSGDGLTGRWRTGGLREVRFQALNTVLYSCRRKVPISRDRWVRVVERTSFSTHNNENS